MVILNLKSQVGKKPRLYPIYFSDSEMWLFSNKVFTYCSQMALFSETASNLTETRLVDWFCTHHLPNRERPNDDKPQYIGKVIRTDTFYYLKSQRMVIVGNPEDQQLYIISHETFNTHLAAIKTLYHESNLTTFGILSFVTL